MLLRLTLSALMLATAGMAAGAADMAEHTKLGEIFAAPPQGRRVAVRPVATTTIAFVPWITSSPKIPGYYGKAGNFEYNSYYGTPWYEWYGRQPYSCWFSGTC